MTAGTLCSGSTVYKLPLQNLTQMCPSRIHPWRADKTAEHSKFRASKDNE